MELYLNLILLIFWLGTLSFAYAGPPKQVLLYARKCMMTDPVGSIKSILLNPQTLLVFGIFSLINFSFAFGLFCFISSLVYWGISAPDGVSDARPPVRLNYDELLKIDSVPESR